MTDEFVARLDPELVKIFQYLPEWDQPGLDALALQQRALEVFAVSAKNMNTTPADPAITQEDVFVDTPEHRVRVRLYRPQQEVDTSPLPALLWLHGGGFILGNIEADDAICRYLCKQADCLIASVEYRLAPQHPYPAAINDCYAALNWLSDSAASLNIDPQRIAVGGCSAGGCLAAGVSLLARDQQGPNLAAQLLMIPALDDRGETFSATNVTEARVWNRSLSQKSWAAYLQGLGDEVPCYAAPARAENLAGLPPTFMSIAELDLLRDEALEYAQRLMQSNVRTELQVYPGAFHGSFMFAPNAAISLRQQAELANALARAVSG